VGAALLLVIVPLAGCGSASSADDLPEPGPLPTIRADDDIRLPLDHYLGPQRDRLALATAHEELVSACMAEQGFHGYPVTDWSHRLDLPDHAFSGFPLVDLAGAREHGLADAWAAGFEEAENAAVGEAFAGWDGPDVRAALNGAEAPDSGEAQDITGDDPVAEAGGCRGEAKSRLYDLAERDPLDGMWLDTLAGRTIAEATEDPRLAAPRRAWSACMEERGYPYVDTFEPAEDPRWQTDPEGERRVAVAQVECTHESRYVDTWVALAAAYQERAIEQNAERLQVYRDARQAVLAAVRAEGLGNVGGRSGGPSPS